MEQSLSNLIKPPQTRYDHFRHEAMTGTEAEENTLNFVQVVAGAQSHQGHENSADYRHLSCHFYSTVEDKPNPHRHSD